MNQFGRFVLDLAIATVTLALAILLPIPNEVGRFLKYGTYPTLIVLTLIFWLCFSELRPWLKYVGLVATAAVLGITLSWLWQGDYADWGVIGGLLPISDASIYMMDAQRLLLGANLSSISSYRTLANGFLSVLLAFDNLQIALFLLALLATLALFALAVEVKNARGALAAAICIVVACFFLRTYIGKVLTETLGLVFSAFAFAFLIRGTRKKSQPMTLYGLGVLTLGMNIRAGALLAIPALLVWAAFVFRNERWINYRFLGAGLLVVVLGFGMSAVQSRVIGFQGSIPFANFADSFYGLASGYKGWRYIREVHPDATSIEKYRYTLLLIQSQPLTLLKGMAKAYLDFFNPASYNVFSFLNLHVAEGGNLYLGAPGLSKSWTYAPMLLLGATGLAGCIRRRKSVWHSMILFGSLGVLLSVPFAPPVDAGMRPYAVTVPLVAFLVSEGVHVCFELLKTKEEVYLRRARELKLSWPLPLSILLVFTVFAGPMLIKAFATTSAITKRIDCPAGEQHLTLQPVGGARLVLEEGGRQHRPNISIGGFRDNAARLWASVELIDQLTRLPAGYSIQHSVDIEELDTGRRPVFLIVDSLALQPIKGPIEACAILISDETFGRFFLARQVSALQQNHE